MGMILSFTGSSGAGKTTIAKELMEKDSRFRFVESNTTRKPRPSDLHGEYRYLSVPIFNEMEMKKEFLWVAMHGGNFYGTTKEAIRTWLSTPDMIGIMIIVPDVLLGLQLCIEEYSDEVRVPLESLWMPYYFVPPNQEELQKRLLKRGDSEGDIKRRFLAESTWERAAEASGIPFRKLDMTRPVDSNVRQVLHDVKTHGK